MVKRLLPNVNCGPPLTLLCVSGKASQHALGDLLSDRELSHTYKFNFQWLAAENHQDLPREFWKHLADCAGLVVDFFDKDLDTTSRLIKAILNDEAYHFCPVLARISDLPFGIKIGDMIPFQRKVRDLEARGVIPIIDGDIDVMANRATQVSYNFEKAQYPLTPGGLENQLDQFLFKALLHHQEIWKPICVNLRIAFP